MSGNDVERLPRVAYLYALPRRTAEVIENVLRVAQIRLGVQPDIYQRASTLPIPRPYYRLVVHTCDMFFLDYQAPDKTSEDAERQHGLRLWLLKSFFGTGYRIAITQESQVQRPRAAPILDDGDLCQVGSALSLFTKSATEASTFVF